MPNTSAVMLEDPGRNCFPFNLGVLGLRISSIRQEILTIAGVVLLTLSITHTFFLIVPIKQHLHRLPIYLTSRDNVSTDHLHSSLQHMILPECSTDLTSHWDLCLHLPSVDEYSI